MTEEALRNLVARLAETNSSELLWTTPLSGRLGGSLGRARLDAALRSEFGVSTPEIYRAQTFGELCAALGAGTAQPKHAIAPIARKANGAATEKHPIIVGVDVEAVAAMPVAPDYREDSFYRETFTPREISYALLQPNPHATFAGMWCAKEALRKADSAVIGSNWKNLEVVHDEAGKPRLVVDGKPARGDLSLSHSEDIAVAVYVEARMSAPAPKPAEVPPAQPAQPALPAPAKTGALAVAIALFSLALSIAVAVLFFLRH